jgi:hypothetical protein
MVRRTKQHCPSRSGAFVTAANQEDRDDRSRWIVIARPPLFHQCEHGVVHYDPSLPRLDGLAYGLLTRSFGQPMPSGVAPADRLFRNQTACSGLIDLAKA